MMVLLEVVELIRRGDPDSLSKAVEKAEEGVRYLEALRQTSAAESLRKWVEELKKAIASLEREGGLIAEYERARGKVEGALEGLKKGLQLFAMRGDPSVLSPHLHALLSAYTTFKRLAEEGRGVRVGGQEGRSLGDLAEEAASRVLEFYKRFKKEVLESDPRPAVENVFLEAERRHKVEAPVQLSTRALEWRRWWENLFASLLPSLVPAAKASPDTPPQEVLSIVSQEVKKREGAAAEGREGGSQAPPTEQFTIVRENLRRLGLEDQLYAGRAGARRGEGAREVKSAEEAETAEDLEGLASRSLELALRGARLMVERGLLPEVRKWFERNRARIALHYGVPNPDRLTFEAFLTRYLGSSAGRVNYGPAPLQPKGERSPAPLKSEGTGGARSLEAVRMV